jgi:Fic family protein
MNGGDKKYIWQQRDWPHWRFDMLVLSKTLSEVHHAQGHLLGRMTALGFALCEEAALKILTQEVIKTSEIEGEMLNQDAVRSSIARKLGLDIGALAPADRHVEGVVEMMLDATRNFVAPLSTLRLFGWHAALFPTGYSGLRQITVGAWRTDSTGSMQVVSGAIGREKVHYEAPPAAILEQEMKAFLDWFNAPNELDVLIKAGLAHLWFVTNHPFDDGNGRIARAIGDMVLAHADKTGQRFYSLSAQIQRERKQYYDLLEQTQKGDLEVTPWLLWFLQNLLSAVEAANESLASVLYKSQFWHHWAATALNSRQIKLANLMLDGFEGKLTTGKWSAIAKCSSDTALRDVNELLAMGMLKKAESGGRNTHYELVKIS